MVRRKHLNDSFSSLKQSTDEETIPETGLTNSVFASDLSLNNQDSLGKDSGYLSSRVKYQRLQDDNDGFLPAQFETPEVRVPIKAIMLASFLFLAGFSAITFGSLSLLGYLDRIPDTGPIVMLVLGFLMFIPGCYHVMIAYYAFQEEPGYSFDDIPDFN